MARILPTLNLHSQPIAQHPIFALEARQRLRKRGAKGSTPLMLAAALVAILVFTAALTVRTSRDPSSLYSIAALLLAVFSVYVDVQALVSSMRALSMEFNSGRIDLLRLTALNERGIVAAKHALGQLRTRRITLALVFARLILIGLVLVLTIIPSIGPVNIAIVLLRQGVFLALVFTLFLIEPFWRNQMMTALGVYISSLNLSPASSVLALGLGLALVWGFGFMIVGVASLGLIMMASLLISSMAYMALDSSLFFGLWFNLFFMVLLGSAIYGFYHLLEGWFLRRALRRVRNYD